MSTDAPNPEPEDEVKKLGQVLTGLDQYVDATRGLLIRRIGRRGTALLFFAFLDSVYAYGLYHPAPEYRRTSSVLFLEAIAPLQLWGTLWLIAGILCLINAFRINDRIGFAGAIAVKVLWGLLFLAGALVVHLDRAYISATLWLCMAGWIAIIASWPEPIYSRVKPRGTDTVSAPEEPPEEVS